MLIGFLPSMAANPIIPLLIFIQIFMAIFVSAQKQNITLGSTLTPSKNPKWVSPDGQFAFGFYLISPSVFGLGVWFENIPPKTLAWTAMKDKSGITVEEGSTLQLSDMGLYLYDAQRNLQWSADPSETVAAAAMLDGGNFVLLNASFQPVWQSFDYPTDTLLPGQTLKWKSTMYSTASSTNHSASRFQLSMQRDGNLVLYAVDRVGTDEGAYWYTGTFKLYTDNPTSLNFDPSGELYLVNSTNITVFTVTKGEARGGQFLRRVTLDMYGILGQHVWNLNGTTTWSSMWQTGEDYCNDVKRQCGSNGTCRLTSDNKPNCSCPAQFHFIDNNDHFQGCQPNSSPPGTVSFPPPLPLPAQSPSPPPLPLPQQQPRKEREGKPGKAFVVIGISLLSASSIFLAASFVFCFRGYGYKARVVGEQHKVVEGLTAYSYKEIEAATGGFTQELGRGTFGTVYKATLPEGRAIAVKTLNSTAVTEGEVEHTGEREFRTEMRVIGSSRHRNLVQLYGFCDEGSHRLLVYEYMINGSLDTVLFVDRGFPDWSMRVQVALGTARGIRYLHEECSTQILHCDIKPQNILLDNIYNPKISDFGLAKLLRAEQTRTYTGPRGTMGYIAPEWFINISITMKVDVYSFGVMLLEIICCRKTLKLDAPENEILLSDWVYECLKNGGLAKLVEQQQAEGITIDSGELEIMVLVGLWCIQEDPSVRPSIRMVVQMLEGTVDIAVPPPPT